MDTLDFTGPLEVLSWASHTPMTATSLTPSPVFTHTVASLTPTTLTNQNISILRHIPISEAYTQLSSFDILVIPGGGSEGVLPGNTEPIHLIKAFAELPKKSDGGVRTILSVCTGALFLGEAGVLGREGMKATTHPLYYRQLEEVCEGKGGVEVVKNRFVVNKVDEEKKLRIITSGGISCGLDSCMWLIGETAGRESMERTAELIQYSTREGVVL
ncbi:class I glutamine amidotransferase-like protein [Rhexocercosporidium sp. MPI-PUGE-AT-0058]|nr:class I glutamine amidotransferase-like protein [Rhexocercosporidium sp. MPI-PUGE-AT-0058]